MSLSPTQLTLRWLRERGDACQVVERWNQWAKIRQDLFGFIDIVSLSDDGIVGIQATSGSNHSARRNKVLASQEAKSWCRAGGKVLVMSWSKKKNRWVERVEDLTEELLNGVH